MRRDLTFGGATLVLAVIYYLLADAIPDSFLADAIGPQGLPKIYAVLLGGLSLALLGQAVAGRWAASVSPPSTSAPHVGRTAFWRMAGTLTMGVAYILIVPSLGYLLSLATLIGAATYVQGGVMNRQVVLVAGAGAVFFWLLFVLLLDIPQPGGWWPSLVSIAILGPQ